MRAAVVLLLVIAGCSAPVEVPTPTPSPTGSPSISASRTPSATPTAPPTVTPSRTPSSTPTVRPTSPTPRPTTPSSCVAPGAAPAVVIGHGPATRRVVALTFDAGSDSGSTAAILDTLSAAGAVASFGVTGDFARRHPDLVARIHREGHQIVNHSDTHRSFTGVSSKDVVLTREARCADLRRAEAAILAAAPGTRVRPWFRPPYGDRNTSVDRDVAAVGYRYVVLWSVDAGGWRGIAAAEVTRRTLAGVAPGGIVLFHVGAASTDALALPGVLSALRARGYGFVTLTSLLG